MIAELISKLAGRKAEATQAATKDWQTLVVKFVDQGDKLNVDNMLAELDRLGKTLEDLEAAAALLTKRRAWAAQLTDGTKAESDYPKLTKQVEDAHADLKRLQEDHEAKYAPLDGKIRATRDAINQASDAKRMLLTTAGEESRRSALDDIDQRTRQLTEEQNAMQKRIRDREDWVQAVGALGHNASAADRSRFAAARDELTSWQLRFREFNQAFEALSAERAKACEVLLKPESI